MRYVYHARYIGHVPSQTADGRVREEMTAASPHPLAGRPGGVSG